VGETDADFNENAPLIQFRLSTSLAGSTGKGTIPHGKIGSGPRRKQYRQSLVLLKISQNVGAGGMQGKFLARPVSSLKPLNSYAQFAGR
jgi:hypothetical protein